MSTTKLNWKKCIQAMLIFLVSYPIFLGLWLKLKPYYAAVVTRGGVYLTCYIKGATVEKIEVKRDKETSTVFIAKKGYSPHGWVTLKMTLSFKVSNYTFNVPLTWALILGLFPLIRWRKRIILEIIALLLVTHILYVFSLTGLQLYYGEIKIAFHTPKFLSQFFWEFLWAFVDNMLIRFEPFLASLYIYFREKGI